MSATLNAPVRRGKSVFKLTTCRASVRTLTTAGGGGGGGPFLGLQAASATADIATTPAQHLASPLAAPTSAIGVAWCSRNICIAVPFMSAARRRAVHQVEYERGAAPSILRIVELKFRRRVNQWPGSCADLRNCRFAC